MPKKKEKRALEEAETLCVSTLQPATRLLAFFRAVDALIRAPCTEEKKLACPIAA